MKYLLILTAIILVGCNQEVSNGAPKNISKLKPDTKFYDGEDINGNKRTCQEISEDTACTEIYGEEDEFADECEDSGNTPIACGCHDYICINNQENSIELVVGVDVDGNERSCNPNDADFVCTLEYTEGDEFGDECKKSGFVAVRCGCHDYICIIN